MNVLLTRPREDSRRFGERLKGCGVTSETAPLLTIHPVDHAPLDLRATQAVLLTSANGARSLAAATTERACRVLAVGHATATAAQEAGFSDVTAAGGDVAKLTALALEILEPSRGRVLHIAGSVVAGDLAAGLAAQGFEVERVVAYRAQTVETMPETACTGLNEGRFAGVVFFSPRTATTFARLSRKAGLGDTTFGLKALCLSRAVADALEGTSWREFLLPRQPESEALAEIICASQETP